MRIITAKYRSLCHECKGEIPIGTEVLYDETIKKTYHLQCRPAEQGDLLGSTEADDLADKLGFTRE